MTRERQLSMRMQRLAIAIAVVVIAPDARAQTFWMAQAQTSQNTGTTITLHRVSVSADGGVMVVNAPPPAACSGEVSEEVAGRVEAAIERSRPESWKESYVSANAGACCDRGRARLSVGREGDGGKLIEHHTEWFADDRRPVPQDVVSLFDLIVEVGKSCVQQR